jgi:Flp pilus assembly protein TadG
MLRLIAKFARAREGMAAVEFGLLLPVLIVLIFGSIEITNAITCKDDVTGVASTAADLVAQETQISNSDMSNIMSALNSLIYPYPASNIKIVITSVIDNGSGGGKVGWSDAQNATARTVGTAVTVPTGLITTGGSVIMTEVTYKYTTPTNHLVKLPITMTNTFYSHPRRVAQIKRVS